MVNVLSEEFIKKYEGFQPPFTELGEFVYYRTYSRYVEELGRRETWLETVRRAVEYNIELELKHLDKQGVKVTDARLKRIVAEAEELFDNHANLRQFLSGRTLWVGGTPVAEKFPLANFNCAFLILDSFEDFTELFYLLMVGTGVGFRVLERDVEKFPTYRTGINLEMLPYRGIPKQYRKDLSDLTIDGDTAIITVGDSKEGWVGALKYYFDILYSYLYKDIKTVKVNFNNVRPKGERLHTFGGTASGHESLKTMFEKIHVILMEGTGTVTPLMALDVANIIGENVVVGGVRRTSEIGIFSPTDNDIREAKSQIFTQDKEGNWITNTKILHRTMSNNSIFFESKPTREELHQIMETMRYTGEPAFINGEAIRRRRPNGEGLNPCAEILLDDKQTCNLTTTNCMAFVKDGKLQRRELLRAMELSGRAGLRMTLVELEIPEWHRKQIRDRLTGVSMTGWQDMIEATGMTKSKEKELLQSIKRVVRRAVDTYAEELGINAPLLATTIKPEGTISQLPTVSSGLHYSHSPYFIRRVRINAHDPLVKVAEELGWSIKPEIGQEWETCSTKVVEFPVKSPAKRTKAEVSALEQLENYKRFMENYVEHNASITVTVRAHEWEQVEQWIWDNWDSYVGISFLALDDHNYPLAPYEAITEEQYHELRKTMKPFDAKLLQKYEDPAIELEEIEDNADCATGACPIR